LIGIDSTTLRDRALRQKRCPVYRVSPLSFRLLDILNHVAELTHRDRRGRKPVTVATLRESI